MTQFPHFRTHKNLSYTSSAKPKTKHQNPYLLYLFFHNYHPFAEVFHIPFQKVSARAKQHQQTTTGTK